MGYFSTRATIHQGRRHSEKNFLQNLIKFVLKDTIPVGFRSLLNDDSYFGRSEPYFCDPNFICHLSEKTGELRHNFFAKRSIR